MRELNEHHSFMGMQKDLVCSKHPVNFLYDARNIRLTSRGDSTMLAITNEKGTRFATDVRGVYVGHACISKYLVLFTSSEGGSTDMIIRIDLTNLDKKILYTGRLNFSENYPITTLPFFENEEIQKVYWVDGLNQPRLINIMKEAKENINTQFDFIRELALKERVSITKNATGGYFPSGVIQYAFTYISKYAQESNIFYVSPLFYISQDDRGAAPNESVSNSFRINITNIDSNFSTIRTYSIERTSIDGTAIVKRVKDLDYVYYKKEHIIVKNVRYYNYDGNDVIFSIVNSDILGVSQPYALIYKFYNPTLVIETDEGIITWDDDTAYIKVATSEASRPEGYGYAVVASSTMAITDFNPYEGVTITDTGTYGDSIDPTEMLYKGNNSVIASAITQKDNTLFLGNIKIEASTFITPEIKKVIKDGASISTNKESIHFNQAQSYYSHIKYGTARRGYHNGISYSHFKHGETYRLGMQFQYKNGAWTDPVFIGDYLEDKRPSCTSINLMEVPTFTGHISKTATNILIDNGFKKVRALVVYPKENERTVLFQGVSSPTVYQTNSNKQSSWYFRHYGPLLGVEGDNMIPNNVIQKFKPFTDIEGGVEIECYLENPFEVDEVIQTLHSPDVEFDDTINSEYSNVKCLFIGEALLKRTDSVVDIQTSSGTIHPNASGARNTRRSDNNGYGIGIAYYNDYIADDNDGKIEPFALFDNPVDYAVYLWNKNGSLNNDTARASGQGIQSAVLKKKVFANRRFYSTTFSSTTNEALLNNSNYFCNTKLQLFNSDQVTAVKIGDVVYQGNVDTALSPKEGTGKYCYDNKSYYLSVDENTGENRGLWRRTNLGWTLQNSEIGDYESGLVRNRNIVRMKYKSTAHLVGSLKKWFYRAGDTNNSLPIIDVINNSVNIASRFGGNTEKALLENQWIPCGEPIVLKKDEITNFNYSYGDTYFGRWDCLKTYAFTKEDENQCVEIGSVQLESRVNPFGRYDKNRDQIDNTMMSPVNFNLMNMVYSQKDNFFTYRILDEDYYKNSKYPNQITWSKEKQAATDVDLWTNITLTNTYDMDGTKGKINYMTTFKDQIFIFQDKAVSNLLFNSRVQIPTSDGVPIEISNNYKVDGHRTLSDGVGCNSGLLVRQTATNLYFIDSITNHLFSIGDGLQDISTSHYMSSWFVNNSIDRLLYDNINHDLYVVNKDEALCYSELLGQFTSFFDYGGIELIESYNGRVFTLTEGTNKGDRMLWYMFEGDYNSFFEYEWSPAPNVVLNIGSHKPWYLTFISNGSDANTVDFDKIFTNIDYRMDLSEIEEGEFKHSAHLTFDYMQITDEYQDTGIVPVKRLMNLNASHWWDSFHHKEANTQKKFRIWRIQIPRALVWKTNRITGERKQVQSNDRIRNPWCKITLGNYGKDNIKALLHDINVQYYI